MSKSMAPAPESSRAEALRALSAEEASFIVKGNQTSVLSGGVEHAKASFKGNRSPARGKQNVCYGSVVGSGTRQVKVRSVGREV